MPQMSPAFEEELLVFLGWAKDGDLWTHPKYRPKPGPKPDVNSPESYWWLLNWLIVKDYTIKYLRARYTKDDHYFCICKSSGKKWSIRDFPINCPNQALLTAILRIKRFPEGQPKTGKDLLKNLSKKSVPNPKSLKERVKNLKKQSQALIQNTEIPKEESEG